MIEIVNVNKLFMLGSIFNSRFFIPAPAINASNIPINDSPAINPEERRIPLPRMFFGSQLNLLFDEIKCAIKPPIRIGVDNPKGRYIPTATGIR